MMMFETFFPCTPGSCKMNGFLAIEQNEPLGFIGKMFPHTNSSKITVEQGH